LCVNRKHKRKIYKENVKEKRKTYCERWCEKGRKEDGRVWWAKRIMRKGR
jgi:hypothetical protein